MPTDLNSAQIPIECPQCKHQTQQTIGRLRRNPTLTCPSCRSAFRIDGNDLDQKIRSIEQQLTKTLNKTIKLKL